MRTRSGISRMIMCTLSTCGRALLWARNRCHSKYKTTHILALLLIGATLGVTVAGPLSAANYSRSQQYEAMRRQQLEAARRKQQEIMRRLQQEAARRRQQEAMRRQQQEAARRRQQEAARRQQQEAARRQQQEAARRQQQEAAKRQQQEAARRQRQEAAKRQQQEAARRKQQEAARRQQQEAEKRKQASEQRKQQRLQRQAARKAAAERRKQQRLERRAARKAEAKRRKELKLRQRAAKKAEKKRQKQQQQASKKSNRAAPKTQQRAQQPTAKGNARREPEPKTVKTTRATPGTAQRGQRAAPQTENRRGNRVTRLAPDAPIDAVAPDGIAEPEDAQSAAGRQAGASERGDASKRKKNRNTVRQRAREYLPAPGDEPRQRRARKVDDDATAEPASGGAKPTLPKRRNAAEHRDRKSHQARLRQDRRGERAGTVPDSEKLSKESADEDRVGAQKLDRLRFIPKKFGFNKQTESKRVRNAREESGKRGGAAKDPAIETPKKVARDAPRTNDPKESVVELEPQIEKDAAATAEPSSQPNENSALSEEETETAAAEAGNSSKKKSRWKPKVQSGATPGDGKNSEPAPSVGDVDLAAADDAAAPGDMADAADTNDSASSDNVLPGRSSLGAMRRHVRRKGAGHDLPMGRSPKSELIVKDLPPQALEQALALGFEKIEEKGLHSGGSIVALKTPPNISRKAARRLLARRMPRRRFFYNHRYKIFRGIHRRGGMRKARSRRGGRHFGQTDTLKMKQLAAPAESAETAVAMRPPDQVVAPGEVCEGKQCFGPKLIRWTKKLKRCAQNVNIGIIDTSFDLSHPAFHSINAKSGDFLNGETPSAHDWHGTAVLSVLAGDPQSGTPGLIPHANFQLATAFKTDTDGNATTDTVKLLRALDWLDELGVQYVNMSFSGPRDEAFESAVDAMQKKGVVFIAAAGNQGPTAPPSYPAAYREVIAVTAVDRKLKNYRHANRGTYVDVAAPGVDIWTALPDAREGFRTGTSFAAPFMTAVVAAGMGNPGLSSKTQLLNQVRLRDLGPAGRDPIYGAGLALAPKVCSGAGRGMARASRAVMPSRAPATKATAASW
jgi:Subtilase family